MELINKVIVITGAGDGLGKATAIELSKAGAKVALVGKTESKLIAVANECGTAAKAYACNLRVPDQIKQTIAQIVSEMGAIDILINNAGVFYEGKFHKEKETEITNMIETNLTGLIFTTKEVLPLMLKQKTGQILNTASIASIEPAQEWAVYAATKHGVKGFTDSLIQEVKGMGIKIMAIYPGLMNTNIIKAAGYDYPLKGRSMEPEDIAKIIAFMLTQPANLSMDHVEIRPITK